jgi:hypothetical protein
LNPGVVCNFESNLPLCDANGLPITQENDKGTNSGFAIGGIVGAIVGGLLVAFVAVGLVVRHRRSSKEARGPTAESAHEAFKNQPRASIARKMSMFAPSLPTTTVSTSTLQEGWSEAIDQSTGARYWINTRTGEFSWSSPDQSNSPAAAPESDVQMIPVFTAKSRLSRHYSSKDAPEAGKWREITDEADKVSYWINDITGEFSYERPASMDTKEEAKERNTSVRSLSGALRKSLSAKQPKNAASPTNITAMVVALPAEDATPNVEEEWRSKEGADGTVRLENPRTGEFAQHNPVEDK